VIALVLLACDGGDDTPPPLLDTGWFEPTGSGGACEERILEWTPLTGATDWYWRDAPSGVVGAADESAYGAWLEDDRGVTVPAALTWSADGLSFAVVPDEPLAPSSPYELVFTDCASVRRVSFATSAYGLPIEGGNASLVDHTWLLDVAGATWIEPIGLGVLFALYIDDPILLGVVYADELHIDLLAAVAAVSQLGEVTQDLSREPWPFPTADFTDAPYFDASADLVVLVVPDASGQDVDVPIEGFRLEGTFSADGATIGGGRLTGLADTRTLGGFFGDENDPTAACDAAGDLGAFCVPCGSDGFPYCLAIEAVGIDGTLVPQLVLDETPPT
jgi:hypothetical protein